MNLEMTDRVVLITGGSDGLGRALGRRLVEEGGRVALMARDPSRLQEATGELVSLGGDALAVPGDVTEPDDLSRLVSAAVERWGRIDGVANNAGRSAASRLEDSEDELWEGDLALKVMAAVRLTRLALPELRKTRGAVVNTLAVAGKAPPAGSTPTSVSRAAGLAFTKAMSRELGPDGIRVNAIVVGLVESGQWERAALSSGTPVETLYERLAEGSDIPLGRVGRAEEFADLASYLLSSRASYVTGTAVNLDGGLCAVT
jgi:NAD(P)-dependent dehydrogenase (short-subunit alcohol dehydrogenase family)